MFIWHLLVLLMCAAIQPCLVFAPMDKLGTLEVILICLSTSQSVHLLKAVVLLEPGCYNSAMFVTWICWAICCICLSIFEVFRIGILCSGLFLQVITMCFTKTFIGFSMRNKKSVKSFTLVLPTLYVLNTIGFVSWFLCPVEISLMFIWLNTSLSTVSIGVVLSNAIGFELRKTARRSTRHQQRTPKSSPRSSIVRTEKRQCTSDQFDDVYLSR